ncbi:MAG: glycosyl transferase, group 1 [Ramlibacter sp.]|uniref:glycosyltransferase family 4 protein n=1 Tax=Ramlibacter sp. TaxID=1917967 RepID=UPI002632A467|nr:glycosyltransferase family 4 protein [Ramlibacter sp.]MDB5751716.1 glycosyl transferase, group 1 [Ramlibacter sp.]
MRFEAAALILGTDLALRYLFIHQNFPGQFRHAVRALADDPANEVVCVGETRLLKGRPLLHPRLRVLGYQMPAAVPSRAHPYLRDYEGHVRRGQMVVRLLLQLRDTSGFQPDVVVAHPGWGEALFLRDVFPRARQVLYCEFYYHGQGTDVGFDPEFPASLDDQLRVRSKNSTQLQSLVAADAGISPTGWQAGTYPQELRRKITVVHDGIDTRVVRPDPQARVEIAGQQLAFGDEVVTYVARNLEPYRGFHTFMRMLPKLQGLRPNARVVIVGGDDVSYGRRLAEGDSYRLRYRSEVEGQVDWARVFFVGKLPYADYLKVLQVSSAHVYLTYPFVLSWSALEAMAAGCLMVASRTAPVQEVVEDGVTGVLVDFFDAEALASRLAQVLADPAAFAGLRLKARELVQQRYDLQSICLPQVLGALRG